MPIPFQISNIQKETFAHLFKLSEAELSAMGAKKMIADEDPGFPCRVSLEDAKIGEEVLLFHFDHHQVNSPYKAAGPIFVRKNGATATLNVNEIPKMLDHRLLSLRAYGQDGMMLDAKTIQGAQLRLTIEELLGNKQVDYMQIHNASPGCYNCQVDRVRTT